MRIVSHCLPSPRAVTGCSQARQPAKYMVLLEMTSQVRGGASRRFPEWRYRSDVGARGQTRSRGS